MTQVEAMKLALDALEWNLPVIEDYGDKEQLNRQHSAITALRQAIEQKQEPVAWVYPEGLEALKTGKPWTAYGTRQEPNNTALYLSPQPDIPPYAWVTFTPYGDEDDVWYENPEGQLLEGWTYKPLYDTSPPQRQPLTDDKREEITKGERTPRPKDIEQQFIDDWNAGKVRRVFDGAKPWVGLTDAEYAELWGKKPDLLNFFRKIEAKLKEKNNE